MNIKLTPEQLQIVQEELESGHFHSIEEVIGEALNVLRSKNRPEVSDHSSGAQREAVSEMLAFIEKNRVRLDGVTVKELIREGHRL